jgi:hypothetical protein
MDKPPPPLNAIQIEVAKSYAEGDFSEIITSADWRHTLARCGTRFSAFS